MIKVRMIRIAKGLNSTLTHLYIGNYFGCYLLEDKISSIKAAGLTCIPSGIYELKVNLSAGMNVKYQSKYPLIHKGMLEITGIPNFNYVFFHIGNSINDTRGCPLVGHYWAMDKKEYVVSQSTFAYEFIYPKLLKLVLSQKNTIVEISNGFIEDGGNYGIDI
jgi:hypothetical protein